LMKPSQTPAGLSMNSVHWSRACNPFIKEPSYPFADAGIVSVLPCRE
jgi:hypothetical protein